MPRPRIPLDLYFGLEHSVGPTVFRRQFLAVVDPFSGSEVAYIDGSTLERRILFCIHICNGAVTYALLNGFSVFIDGMVSIEPDLSHGRS